MATELKMDEATRKSLLGLMPFTQNGAVMYTPECMAEIPEAFRSVFKQRALTRQEFNDVREIYRNDTVTDKQTPLWAITRKTIIGWDRVLDMATGEAIPFKASANGGLDEDLWEGLPLVVRRELTTNVQVISGLLHLERTALKS